MLDSGLVIRQLYHEFLFIATLFLVADKRTVNTNTLCVALGKYLPGIYIEQLVLKRRAAGIDHQYVHRFPLF